MGSLKSERHSLRVCKTRGQEALSMDAALRWFWHAEYSCSAPIGFWRKKSVASFDPGVLPWDPLLTQPHLSGSWRYYFFSFVTLSRHFSEAVLIALLSFGTCEIHTHTHHTLTGVPTCEKIWPESNANAQTLMGTPTAIWVLHTSYQIPSPGSSGPLWYDLVPKSLQRTVI